MRESCLWNLKPQHWVIIIKDLQVSIQEALHPKIQSQNYKIKIDITEIFKIIQLNSFNQ
jgi:hypothetical protein